MGSNPGGYLLKSFFTLHAVGSNSLETTYILFELPYLPIHRPFTTSWLSSIGRQLMILTRGTTTTFYTYLLFSTTRFIKCMVTWILTKDPLYWRNSKCSEIVIINTILLLFFNLLPRSSIYLLLSLRGIASSYCQTTERRNFVSEQSFRRSVIQRKEKKMFSALAIRKNSVELEKFTILKSLFYK